MTKDFFTPQPVAYVTGYYNGYPVLQHLDNAAVLSTGAVLYVHPPATDVLQLVEALRYIAGTGEHVMNHLEDSEIARLALEKWEGK